MNRTLLLAAAGLALATSASANDMLVLKHQPARAMLVDSTNGAVLDPVHIDVDGLVGLGGIDTGLTEAVLTGTGELWISDWRNSSIYRFNEAGTAYLGAITGHGDVNGMHAEGGTLWFATVGPPHGFSVVSMDIATQNVNTTVSVVGAYDVCLYDGNLLISTSSGYVFQVDPVTLNYVGTLWQVNGGSIGQMRPLDNGNLEVAVGFPALMAEIDSAGNLVNFAQVSNAPRGGTHLGNGDLLTNGASGTFLVDGSGETLLDVGQGSFITYLDSSSGGLGDPYCSANANSTGSTAEISATGSTSMAANDLTLAAGPVPDQPFLFFFGPNQIQAPFGNGYLCVGGGIVRLNPPAVAAGNVATRVVDLPTEVVTTGTHNFQCWYRDPAGGGSAFNTSNGLSLEIVP